MERGPWGAARELGAGLGTAGPAEQLPDVAGGPDWEFSAFAAGARIHGNFAASAFLRSSATCCFSALSSGSGFCPFSGLYIRLYCEVNLGGIDMQRNKAIDQPVAP